MLLTRVGGKGIDPVFRLLLIGAGMKQLILSYPGKEDEI